MGTNKERYMMKTYFVICIFWWKPHLEGLTFFFNEVDAYELHLIVWIKYKDYFAYDSSYCDKCKAVSPKNGT